MRERAEVDAKKHQIIWEDGERLPITASARRVGANHRNYPLNFVDEHVTEWLEGEFAARTYSLEQSDELDQLTEA